MLPGCASAQPLLKRGYRFVPSAGAQEANYVRRWIVRAFLDLEERRAVRSRHQGMPDVQGVSNAMLSVSIRPGTAGHAPRFVKRQHVEITAQHHGQLGFGAVPVGTEVGVLLGGNEKTLHRIAWGRMDIEVGALAGAAAAWAVSWFRSSWENSFMGDCKRLFFRGVL